MQRMINRLNALHYDRSRSVTTIVNGVEYDAAPPTHRVRILPTTTNAVLQHRVGPHWVNVPGVAAVTQANMTALVNFIRNNTYANHRDTLTNSVPWRTFYHVAPRVLTYLTAAGVPLAPAPNTPSVPCSDCGLVLPLRNITVDHQRPQGGNPHEPVAKIFRTMGLCTDAPTGPKGTHFLALQMPLVGGIAGAGAGTVGAKYTLNNVGKIYYTIAEWAGVLADGTLETACMNHIINLRPLCNACNTPNRNVRHF